MTLRQRTMTMTRMLMITIIHVKHRPCSNVPEHSSLQVLTLDTDDLADLSLDPRVINDDLCISSPCKSIALILFFYFRSNNQ